MKATLPRFLPLALLTGLCCGISPRLAAAEPEPARSPTEQTQPAQPAEPAPPADEKTAPVPAEPAPVPAVEPNQGAPVAPETAPSRPTDERGSPGSPPSSARDRTNRIEEAPVPELPATPVKPVPPGEKGLRFNFRGVPLEQVLNYLSDAAGFIINLETDVRGKVDVFSNQLLNQDEAVELLGTVLSRNGMAAIRNGRTLTIVDKEGAKKRPLPVISGNDPAKIPKSEEMVTQIIPVRFISAVQLVKDLQALLPSSATLTANEGGNALVLTDAQSSIRHMVEIVQALDTAIASVSVVRVFPLEYADSKSVATTISSLFQSQDSNRNQNGAGRFFNAMRGGGPGGMFGGPGGGDGTSANNGRAPTPKVTAVSDDRSNSVVVSAPDDQMTIIEGVIKQIDRDVEDITELRVFRLKHADPQETADLLSSLFADTSTSSNSQNQRGMQFQFGGMFGGRGGNRGGGSAASDTTARSQLKTKVVAVADNRTGSVVVSASKPLMEQITRMIEQLDADPSKKKKVFVYNVENSDPVAMQEILQNLFPQDTSSGLNNRSSSTRQNNNQLQNRTTQNNNQNTRSTGFGNTSGRTGGGQ